MPSKILITGVAGMVGSHLYEGLRSKGSNVVGTYYKPTVEIEEIEGWENLLVLDIRYRGEVERTMRTHRPDVIFHLAAQSLPVRSWAAPEETIDVNVGGTVNLFEAIKSVRDEAPSYDPIVVVACSSAQYGASLKPENVPIKEDALLLPLHPYGVSKVAQDLLTYQYWVNDRIRGIRARIFNSTGPRKTNDVISDFARRVAYIVRDGGKLRVGNLTPQRAILDVRDLVSALVLLAERGEPGEAYNICSKRLCAVGELVPIFSAAAGLEIGIEVDERLLRPSDEPVIFGDATKLKEQTGWEQVVSLESTVTAVLDYERRRLNA